MQVAGSLAFSLFGLRYQMTILRGAARTIQFPAAPVVKPEAVSELDDQFGRLKRRACQIAACSRTMALCRSYCTANTEQRS
jgi:hypothetical protein